MLKDLFSSTSLVLLVIMCIFSLCKAQCPAELDGLANTVYTPSMGCVWAEPDQSQRYATYNQALVRCKEILGEEARVAEILSEDDQATVVSVMKEAESMFISQIVSYWWSGLNDVDDDGVWEWVESGEAEYANWNDQAVPEHKSFNCMQLLSGTVYEGEWMTILCGEDNYTSALSLCQLN